jgi:sugar lactone lactonase YvrE
VGFFQNCHGEQLVFTYDRATHSGIVRHGDTGWESSYPVKEGVPQGLEMDAGERAWVSACWNAVTRFRK